MPKHRHDDTAADGGASKRRSPPSSRGDGNEPDFNSSCPYEILGVPKNATHASIKLSYRKLALKHHPDRQTSDIEKQTAHHNFAAIGHAYEILSDERRRREYDEGLQQQRQQQQSRRQQHRGFDTDPFSEFDNIHFTDPFELFNQLFARELNNHRGGRDNTMSSDPFFNDPFFSGGSLFNHGSGLSQMMSNSFNMMNSMSSQMNNSRSIFGGGFDQQFMSSNIGGGFGGGGGSYNFISSSSSSNYGGAGHQSVSTSTRTTVVNGVRQTVHERTITHPDGRVERHVTTEGGNNRISSSSNQHAALDYDGGSGRRRRW